MHLTTRPSTAAALTLGALGLGATMTPAAAEPAPEPTVGPPGPTAPLGDDGGVDTYVVRFDVTETTVDGTVVDHDAGSFEVSAEEMAAGVSVTSADVEAAAVDEAVATAVVGSPSPLDEGCRRVTVGFTSATDYPWGRATYWTYEQAKHF